jgi:hypothetical protein
MESITAVPISLPGVSDDCLPEGRVAVDMGSIVLDHTNPDLVFEFDTQGFSPTRPLTAIRSIYFDASGITAGAVFLNIDALGQRLQFKALTQGFIPLLVPTLPQVLKFSGMNIGGTVTDGTFKATLYNFTLFHSIWTVI